MTDAEVQQVLEDASVELQRADQRVQKLLDKQCFVTANGVNLALHLVLNVRDSLDNLWQRLTYGDSV